VSCQIPTSLPHLTTADQQELTRLLTLVFKADDAGATKWLTGRSEVFRCTPLDLLKRDAVGVVRVIDYLKDAAP
jgi:hypothetical protein